MSGNDTLQFLANGVDMEALPHAAPGCPRINGRIKERPEDFVVEEVPAYPFAGSGDHLLLYIEKRDVAGGDMLRLVGKALGVRDTDIGTAGTKDRRAVTRQWISVPAQAAAAVEAGRLNGPEAGGPTGISLLEMTRHTNKLKAGHLKGNRFRILVRDANPDAIPELTMAAEIISRNGFPNIFGSQRFGRNSDNLATGMALLGMGPDGGRRPRLGNFERRMSISAIQSALFNIWVKARYEDGLTRKVLEGDVMAKTATGGMFVCTDSQTDQARFDTGEIGITGPMFGSKMMAAAAAAGLREEAILTAAGMDAHSFDAAGKLAEGTRRDLVVIPEDLSVQGTGEGILFSFFLPKGCYASVLMREFVEDVRGIG